MSTSPDDTLDVPTNFSSSLLCPGCALCRVDAVHPRSECTDPPTLRPDGAPPVVEAWS